MTDPVRSKSIDELEVSVKTVDFLEKLGVSTVGELLDLPRLQAPRLVAAELTSLFEDLGVTYEGELVTASAPPKARSAKGGVAEILATIDAWLDENLPGAGTGLRDPATPDAIASAERALGRALPGDYKELLRLHDGQEDGAPMVAWCTLLPLEEVVARHAELVKSYPEATAIEDTDVVGAGIKPVVYTHGWIPIGRSPRGRDIMCIDLEPAKGGTAGQVILLAVDDDARDLVAKSVRELLGRYFEELQNGDLELDEDDDDDLDEGDDDEGDDDEG